MKNKSKITSKNSLTDPKNRVNFGKWTRKENEEFRKLVKELYRGNITKKDLYSRFPSRNQLQILSKLNKKKYAYQKEFGIYVSKEKVTNLQNVVIDLKENTKDIETKKEYVQFQDEITAKSIIIDKDFLCDLIKSSYNFKLDGMTLKIDENILKTLAVSKCFMTGMRSYVTKEKNKLGITPDQSEKFYSSSNLQTSKLWSNQKTTPKISDFDSLMNLNGARNVTEIESSGCKWNELKFVDNSKSSEFKSREDRLNNSSVKFNGYLRSNISVSKYFYEENSNFYGSNFID